MAKLKSKDFYPDFHVNIRKDGRVNGVEPVTLKDMGLPFDLDYPEQKVGDLSKQLYENLVEEFIFLIDELIPRDIQDLFYKATLAPRQAYWKLFEEAARRMQLSYYLNCHRDEADGVYENIRFGIECFLQEGRTLAEIYLKTCITKDMLLDVVDWSCGFDSIIDENVKRLMYVELALFRASKYNYKRFITLPGCDEAADIVLYGKDDKPELVFMICGFDPEYDDYLEIYDEEREAYDGEQEKIAAVEKYCDEKSIAFLRFSEYEAQELYDQGDILRIIRRSVNDPVYAKGFVYRNRTSSDHIFCDVEFEPGGKTYCYLADDDSYEVGDTVLVPAGADNHEAVVRIVDKNYYTEENAPYPVDIAKHIISRVDEDDIDSYLLSTKGNVSVMAGDLSLIFENKPEQWGLRGDPYLWDEMKDAFCGEPLDISERDLAGKICNYYEKAVGEPLKYGSNVFVERFAHGGMISGHVSGEFWICRGIPILIDNFRRVKEMLKE